MGLTQLLKTIYKRQYNFYIMSLVLIWLVSSIFFSIISFESAWWFLMASTIFIIIVISVYIYPTYISPLFNKFDNLEDES